MKEQREKNYVALNENYCETNINMIKQNTEFLHIIIYELWIIDDTVRESGEREGDQWWCKESTMHQSPHERASYYQHRGSLEQLGFCDVSCEHL